MPDRRPLSLRAAGDRAGTAVGRWQLEERAFTTLVADGYAAIGRKGARALVEVLRPSGDSALTAAFRREAHAPSRVRHRAVGEVLDEGTTDDGAPWVARPLPVGTPLLADLRGGGSRFEFSRRARMMALATALGEALAAAHKIGVIHGDLRPETLLRDPLALVGFVGGEVLLRVPLELRPASHFAYAAPEVALGAPPSPAADQFAFALLLASVLQGAPLRRAASVDDARYAAERPPVLPPTDDRALAPLVPHLRRALAEDPADRFPDVAAFVGSLVRADLEVTHSIPPAPTPSPAPATFVGGAEAPPAPPLPVIPAAPALPAIAVTAAEREAPPSSRPIPVHSFPPVPSFPPAEPAPPKVPSLLPARPTSPRMKLPVALLEVPAAGRDTRSDPPPAVAPRTPPAAPLSADAGAAIEAHIEAARAAGTATAPPAATNPLVESSAPSPADASVRAAGDGASPEDASVRASRSLPRISAPVVTLQPLTPPKPPVLPWVIAAIAVVVAVVAVATRR